MTVNHRLRVIDENPKFNRNNGLHSPERGLEVSHKTPVSKAVTVKGGSTL